MSRASHERRPGLLAGAAGASRALSGSPPARPGRCCVARRNPPATASLSLSASCFSFEPISVFAFRMSVLWAAPRPLPAPWGLQALPLRAVRAAPSPAVGSPPPRTCRVWRGAAAGPPGPLPYTLPSLRLGPVSDRGSSEYLGVPPDPPLALIDSEIRLGSSRNPPAPQRGRDTLGEASRAAAGSA